MDISIVSLIATLIVAATPILLAATGELIVEKAGVLNLGVEGMMIIGAICGFIAAVNSGSPLVGFIAAALAGAVLSMLFALLTQVLLANQVASGLALTLFGLGLAALLGHSYSGIKPPSSPKMEWFGMADLPVIGPIIFNHDLVVYFSIALVLTVWMFLKFTRAGLVLRAVGENHDAAHALGYKVVRIRCLAILFGGACAGLGGAYLSLVRVPQWTEGMTAGAGWIALAIVVFASWKPWRLVLGAYLFGGITGLQLSLQASGVNAYWAVLTALFLLAIYTVPILLKKPSSNLKLFTMIALSGALAWCVRSIYFDKNLDPSYLNMAPYLVTILVLVIMSADRARASLNAPASLGKIFHASH